jgi:uncharacterized membrane protein YgaE (UPF0421/DUF939 family)
LRDAAGAAGRRGLGAAWPVAQAALAAALAWSLAHDVVGHAQPFFAPIAAAVSLSATIGERARQALRMMVGVTLGILIAQAAVATLGTGPAQIGLSTLLAMAVAVAVGGSPMLVNQAGASAILVVALNRPGVGGERLIDALIGGGVALVISLLVFPAQPLGLLRRGVRQTLLALAAALRESAAALRAGTPRDPEWTLRVTRAVHQHLAQLNQTRRIAHDVVRISPTRWRLRRTVDRVLAGAANLDLLADTALGLVRVAALESADGSPLESADGGASSSWAAEATSTLADGLARLADGDAPAARALARRLAADARPATPHGANESLLSTLLRHGAADLARLSDLDPLLPLGSRRGRYATPAR